ncbi:MULTISPECIES: hypothetical protein [unclassified Streptomyces]|nr:hypothetical protein [Streptomyces sp. WAC 01438]AZM60863.1 hypothetical protein DLM49_16030 [Streptomyces sp. WAC 01438]RSM90310.1 hypothetical protein DMA10_28655 [Streptomyces sp. WAC 01420]
MLPPSAIAGVSTVCALGSWVFTQPMALRVLAAIAAVTAIAGAVVMRHWDAQAGKRVADLTRARASDEWRFEERIAELESDLEESRELRVKLEQRLRAKRAELAGLRNEHASLLRRYAASEVDRATVLEERRVLEIEAAVPARALPAGTSDSEEPEAADASGEAGDVAPAGDGTGAEDADATRDVFSPEGSKLFLKADAALARLAGDAAPNTAGTTAGEAAGEAGEGTDGQTDGQTGEPAQGQTREETGQPDEAGEPAEASDDAGTAGNDDASVRPASDAADHGTAPERNDGPKGDGTPEDDGPEPTGKRKPEPAQEDEAEGRPEAADDHERAAASGAPAASPVPPVRQPSGHFTVPTAVAVVPPTEPVRRPVTEGGFDFFGTKQDQDADGSALDTVQNEDLADVVGQEALALHKAENETAYKPAGETEYNPAGETAYEPAGEPEYNPADETDHKPVGEAARGAAGQVIDLTEHDETEHIDVEGLRSAAS